MDSISPETESKNQNTQEVEIKKKAFPWKLLVPLVILLAIIGFIWLRNDKPEATNPQNEQKEEATTSAKPVTSGPCGENQEFANSKQGYKVCFPAGWQKAALKTSDLIIGFDPKAPSESFPGMITVAIDDTPVDVALQEAQNNSSKFEFGNAKVGERDGKQIVYTRLRTDSLFATHKVAVSTFVNHFGRTYAVTLNTNEETQDADVLIYEDFLEEWQFIEDTASPPWSTSHNILIYSPWPGDKVGETIELSGEANAFEAVVNIRVKDEDGHVLLQTTTETETGNARSQFSAKLTYETPSTKEGTIEVYTIAASDGVEQDKVIIPIQFP